MSEPLKVRMKLGPFGSQCRIEVDGLDISDHVMRAEVVAEARGATTLRLDLVNVDVEAQGWAFLRAENEPPAEES